MPQRKFAIVTGASTGIGYELGRLAAKEGYDLLVAADTPLVDAAAAFRDLGADVRSIEADLSTFDGVQRLVDAIGERDVDVLCANAGHGLGRDFLGQDPADWRGVIDINITGGGSVQVDTAVDASVWGLFYFGAYEARDPRVVATMKAARDHLWCKTPVGGMARYTNDYYHQVSQDIANVPGNPWFICTMWLAQYEIEKAKSVSELDAHALPCMRWVVDHALPSGVLAEQVNPYTGAPMSVSPLTWSHATFVAVVNEYTAKRTALKAKKK